MKSFKIPATRYTREIYAAFASRDSNGRFNPNMGILFSSPLAGWAVIGAISMPHNGKHFTFIRSSLRA